MNIYLEKTILGSNMGMLNHTMDNKREIMISIFSNSYDTIRIYENPVKNENLYSNRLLINIWNFLSNGRKLKILLTNDFICNNDDLSFGINALIQAQSSFPNLQVKSADDKFDYNLSNLIPNICDFQIGDNRFLRVGIDQSENKAYYNPSATIRETEPLINIFDSNFEHAPLIN